MVDRRSCTLPPQPQTPDYVPKWPYVKAEHDPRYSQIVVRLQGGKLKPEYEKIIGPVLPYKIRQKVAIRFFTSYKDDPVYPFKTWQEQYRNIEHTTCDTFYHAIYCGYRNLGAPKPYQAKGIPTRYFLEVMHDMGTWPTWKFMYNAFPRKVVIAKLKRLKARGLADGCACGCRGDWQITDAGRRYLTQGV